MAITVICNESEPGAYAPLAWIPRTERAEIRAGERSPIYVRTFAHGAVVSLREANYYDDSDFYATYWDAESRTFTEVMYGTTRGWTYAAGASVDATPEVLARWLAHREAQERAARAAAAEREARTPRIGKSVRILANRGKAKHLVGRIGRIFWMQEHRSKFGTWSYGWRLGVEVDGERVFIDADKTEVVPTPITEEA